MFVLYKISITKISCEIPYIKIFQKPINFTSTLKYHVFSSSIPLPPFSSHFSSTFLHHVFYPHVVTTWLSSTSSLFVSSYLASSSSIHQPSAPSPTLFTDARSLFVIHFPASTLFHRCPDTIEAMGKGAPPSHQGGRILHVLLPRAEVEHVEVEGGEYTRTILFRYRIPTSTFYRLSFFVTSRTLWSGAG